MIRDNVFKCLFILLIGFLVPFGAGLIDVGIISAVEVSFTLAFFLFVSHLIWQGSVNIITALRSRYCFKNKLPHKLALLLSITTLFGMISVALAVGLWQLLIVKGLFLVPIIKADAIAGVLVILLVLIYESVLLSAELNRDERVMLQLEQERLQAKTSILQNELDPHFLFNSLNALSYLVQHDQQKAHQFVHKLSNVFKYLLINKQKEWVPLEEELVFLDDYYFLLQVRFDDSIQIKNEIHTSDNRSMVLPCTLQALVENAIKHNFFSDNEPLVISIQMSPGYITVANTVKPKSNREASTHTGLENLKSRYHLLMQKSIVVQETGDQFSVSIPIENKAA